MSGWISKLRTIRLVRLPRPTLMGSQPIVYRFDEHLSEDLLELAHVRAQREPAPRASGAGGAVEASMGNI